MPHFNHENFPSFNFGGPPGGFSPPPSFGGGGAPPVGGGGGGGGGGGFGGPGGLGAAIGIGLGVISIIETEKARKRAEKQAEEAFKRQERLIAQFREEEKSTRSEEAKTAARNKARQRQRQLATGGQGRSDTILTSPLGTVSAEGEGVRKTLLGA